MTTYLAARNVASRRPLARHVVGVDGPDLPPFARQRAPLTALPSGSLADTFVHPHGLFRNVLVTGPLAVVGTRSIGGREAILVRSEHPRASKVLVDRPDRSIEVGIDRQFGFLLLLSETIAGPRHAPCRGHRTGRRPGCPAVGLRAAPAGRRPDALLSDLVSSDGLARCGWAGDDPLMVAYHDDEWGRPRPRRAAPLRDALPGGRPGRPLVVHDPAPSRRLPGGIRGLRRRAHGRLGRRSPGTAAGRHRASSATAPRCAPSATTPSPCCACARRRAASTALALVGGRRDAHRQPLRAPGRPAGSHPALGRTLARPCGPRLPLRGPRHRLRLPAVRRRRQRPPGGLLPAPGVGVRWMRCGAR